MDVDLAQDLGARVNETMRCVRWNDDDATRFYLALLISDRNRRAAFDSECDFDIGMFM